MSWIYDHQKWKEDLVKGDIGGNKKNTQHDPSFDIGFTSDAHTEEILDQRSLPNDSDTFKRKETIAKRRKKATSFVTKTAGALFLAAATVTAVPPLRYPAVDFLEQQLYRLQFKENRYSNISIVDDNGNEMYPSVVENRLERLMRWYDNDLSVNGDDPTQLLTILDASMTREIPEIVERGTTDDGRQFIRYEPHSQRLVPENATYSFYTSRETDDGKTSINIHAYPQPLTANYEDIDDTEELAQEKYTIPYQTIESLFSSILNRYQDSDDSTTEEFYQLIYEQTPRGEIALMYEQNDGTLGHIRVVDENDQPIAMPKLEEQMTTYFENKGEDIAFFNNGASYLINALNDMVLRTNHESTEQEFFDLAESKFLFYSEHAEQDGNNSYLMTFLPYTSESDYETITEDTQIPTYTIRYDNLLAFYEDLIQKTHNPAPRNEPVFNTRLASEDNDTLELRIIDDFDRDTPVEDQELYVHQDYLTEIQEVHNQIYRGLANIRNTNE